MRNLFLSLSLLLVLSSSISAQIELFDPPIGIDNTSGPGGTDFQFQPDVNQEFSHFSRDQGPGANFVSAFGSTDLFKVSNNTISTISPLNPTTGARTNAFFPNRFLQGGIFDGITPQEIGSNSIGGVLVFDDDHSEVLELDRQTGNPIAQTPLLMGLGLGGEYFPTQYLNIFLAAGFRIDLIASDDEALGVVRTDNFSGNKSTEIIPNVLDAGEFVGVPSYTVWFNSTLKKGKYNNLTEVPTYDTLLVFFKADDGINGRELWTTDGTAAGTHMVKNIGAASNPSFPSSLTPMMGKLYFVAAGPENSELWVSDGTEAGTSIVKDINPGGGNANIGSMININNTLYFRANNGTDGLELWKSDGTANGTVMIKDIYPGTGQFSFPNDSSPGGFTLFNGLIYFSARDGIHGRELWVTDGTESGTHMVKNINNTGDGSASSSPKRPGIVNGNVMYFYADDGVHGQELWVTDGTSEGTKLAYDLKPGFASSNLYNGWGLLADGDLYVSAEDGVIGYELFIFEDVPTSVPMASCSLKVFLEGPYNSGSMSTNLSTNIPLRQPFNNAEFGHYGDETITSAFITTNNIVDWVKVELRSGASAATSITVASKAVLVNSNGDLVDLDGSLDIDFKWVEAGDYYVTVYHRNHLAVLSSQTVTLTN